METKTVASINREVSRIGLGTWAIGGWMWGGTNERESIKTIRTALDKGINLIDTAPVYGFGKSEEIVGDAITEHGGRENIILTTKVALEWTDDEKVYRNSTPQRIKKEIEHSLKRLQTDYVDIYLVHWPDPLVPFEETAEAMNDLYKDGKIRAIGVSNYSPKQMDAFATIAPLQMNQPPYNIFEREIEDDIVPYCSSHDVALMTYGALCRGLLSGKMTKDRDFTGDDLRQYDPKFQQPRYDQYLEAVSKLDEFAQSNFNRSVIHLAVRWVLDQGIDIALWGARKPDQLDAVDKVSGWSLSEADSKRVREIVEETVTDPIGPEFMAPPDRKKKEQSATS